MSLNFYRRHSQRIVERVISKSSKYSIENVWSQKTDDEVSVDIGRDSIEPKKDRYQTCEYPSAKLNFTIKVRLSIKARLSTNFHT